MTHESRNDQSDNKRYEIKDRAFEFAARTAKFVNFIPKDYAGMEYGRQLIRSSASVGANLEEADGSLTKREFVSRLSISRREARESKYWLKLIQRTGLLKNEPAQKEALRLANEAQKLVLIFSAIIQKVENHTNKV